MKEAGRRCEVVAFEGAGHGFFNEGRGDGTACQKTLEDMDRFLVSLDLLARKPSLNPVVRVVSWWFSSTSPCKSDRDGTASTTYAASEPLDPPNFTLTPSPPFRTIPIASRTFPLVSQGGLP